VRSGLAVRPAKLGWGALVGGGMLAGIGFTMALLIAGLAFEGTLLQAAKLGILAASVISAAGGLTLLALLGGDGGHRDFATRGAIPLSASGNGGPRRRCQGQSDGEQDRTCI